MDYSKNDPMLITLTIQPDNCLEKTGGANAPSARTIGTTATGSGI